MQRAGTNLNGLSFSNGGTFYATEENVLSFGVMSLGPKLTNNTSQTEVSGMTKTMRRLQSGDKLVLLYYTTSDVGASIGGVVQFFCKS